MFEFFCELLMCNEQRGNVAAAGCELSVLSVTLPVGALVRLKYYEYEIKLVTGADWCDWDRFE